MQTRFLSLAVNVLLSLLNKAIFLGRTDLSLIMTNSTEKLLNLPGNLPFFPTRVTDVERVEALIRRLHPVTCNRVLIRLGPDGDGGYLVPNDLEGIEACFSPGVSDISGFEKDCAEMGMKVFMADASVKEPPITHSRFGFIQKFIGATTEGEFLSLDDWVSSAAGESQGDLMLQMDIEGYEYEALLSASESLLERFRIIVVEFHFMEYLFSEPLFAVYRHVFGKILRTHTCVHIHPNNCCQPITVRNLHLLQMGEFTFLRNDRISNASFTRVFPHPLDRDNTGKPSYPLPESFYRSQ